MKPNDVKPGDVVRYTPSQRHCREGKAVAIRPVGPQILVDSFWNLMGPDSHVLTDEELATAELVFNTNDYDELDRYDHGTPDRWKRYAPNDRQTVSAQHGLQHRYFVRKGATEDWATIVARAEEYVRECEADRDAAIRRAKYALDELNRIRAQQPKVDAE